MTLPQRASLVTSTHWTKSPINSYDASSAAIAAIFLMAGNPNLLLPSEGRT
jgi:hypothetical protein